MFTAYHCAGLSLTWAMFKDTCVSCQQVSAVNKCLLSTSVDCQQVYAVNKSQLSTSVSCQQVAAVNKCQLSKSVSCQQVSAVKKCQLSTSVQAAAPSLHLALDTEEQHCISFNYTGCGGNANRFAYVMCLFLLSAYHACTKNKYYE